MLRDYRLSLDDMLEAISRIRDYTAGMNQDAFASDKKTQDAVVRNLEIIGEAARGLREEVKRKKPEIEWRKIADLRNILIHKYFGIHIAILWDIIQNKLDGLESACRSLLEE